MAANVLPSITPTVGPEELQKRTTNFNLAN